MRGARPRAPVTHFENSARRRVRKTTAFRPRTRPFVRNPRISEQKTKYYGLKWRWLPNRVGSSWEGKSESAPISPATSDNVLLPPLMQYSKCLVTAFLVTSMIACKRPDPIRLQPTIEEPAKLASMVEISNLAESGQLIRGFYDLQ